MSLSEAALPAAAQTLTAETEHKLQQRTPGARLVALDALRGLAAFIVIWHHFREAFNMSQPRWYQRPFVAGHAAVVLFFVLSGYVLSLPYWKGRQLPYGLYLVRRFFRIYVPYATATAFALLVGSHLLFSHLPLTEWFNRTWQTPFTGRIIAAQFFKISTAPTVNTAFWSLRYEMEMSLIFPAVCWLLLRLRPWGALIFALVVEKIGFLCLQRSRFGFWQETSDTLIFASCFLLGAILAWKREAVATVYRRTPLWVKVPVLLAIVVAYYGEKESVLPFAACGAIVFALHSRASRILDTFLPEYLGRISYSMYLVHGTVLWATLILLYGKLPLLLLGVVYAAITLGVSHGFCVLVEEPAMKLGKRLAGGSPAPFKPLPASQT